jgi:hypothetical protein
MNFWRRLASDRYINRPVCGMALSLSACCELVVFGLDYLGRAVAVSIVREMGPCGLMVAGGSAGITASWFDECQSATDTFRCCGPR